MKARTLNRFLLVVVGLAVTVALGAYIVQRPSNDGLVRVSPTAAATPMPMPPMPMPPMQEPLQEPLPAPLPEPTAAKDDHDHAAEAAVKRLTAAELRTMLDRGEAVVVDVRDADPYSSGHIPGSMHIPLSSVQSRIQSLPRGKTIVAYCT